MMPKLYTSPLAEPPISFARRCSGAVHSQATIYNIQPSEGYTVLNSQQRIYLTPSLSPSLPLSFSVHGEGEAMLLKMFFAGNWIWKLNDITTPVHAIRESEGEIRSISISGQSMAILPQTMRLDLYRLA